MKIANFSLRKEPYKSFVFHIERNSFVPLHHHPEYEIVLIVKGKGKRIIGDKISRFRKNDLVFVGPYLPHQWICDNTELESSGKPQHEAYIIQFNHDFLGRKFFYVPENLGLKKFLKGSTRGYEIIGKSKTQLINIFQKMKEMNDIKQFYALFDIFEIFNATDEYRYIASPNPNNEFLVNENDPMRIVMQYILQNFQKNIQIQDLLNLTNMSYASFYLNFKKYYKCSFKDYLLKVRIGYACKLLIEGIMNISEIAYESGFKNLSNFNRQFKKIKNITPRQYQKQFNINLVHPHNAYFDL